jgi:general secretion pathway protein G
LMRSRFGITLPVMRRPNEFAVIGEKHPDAHFLYFDAAALPVLVPVWPGLFQRGRYSDRAVTAAIRTMLGQFGLGKPPMPLHPYLKWFALFILPALVLNYTFVFRPTMAAQREKLNVLRAKAGVMILQRNLVRLKTRTGALPPDERWPESLQAEGLIPKSMEDGYAAHSTLLDPWGFRYHYRYPGIQNPASFDLYSLGEDGKEGGEGPDADIGNWEGRSGQFPPAVSAPPQ